jgi:ribosomal protein L7/L12
MSDKLSDEKRQEILNAILAGKKIEAIKLYRAATGQGLKEAKDFVDQLEAALRKENPEAFQGRSNSGCGVSVLLVAMLIAWAVLCWNF